MNLDTLTDKQRHELFAFLNRRLPDASTTAVVAIANAIASRGDIVDADGELTAAVVRHFEEAVPLAREAGLLPPSAEVSTAPSPEAVSQTGLTKEDITAAIKDGMKPEQPQGERAEFLAWRARKYPGLSEDDFNAFRAEAQASITAEWLRETEQQRRAASMGYGKRSKITALPGYVMQMPAADQNRYANLLELKAAGLATDDDFERAGFQKPESYEPKTGGAVKGFNKLERSAKSEADTAHRKALAEVVRK